MMRDRPSWRRLRRIFRRDPGPEVDAELDFHLDQRIRDYIARGMDPESARKAALDRLGDIERARMECTILLSAEQRTEERRMRLNVSWLDVKLGVRMVAKYPGLSLVSVLGMAVAITIGAYSARSARCWTRRFRSLAATALSPSPSCPWRSTSRASWSGPS